MIQKIRLKIEAFLYTRGFYTAIVRHLLCTQILIIGLSFVIGLALLPLTSWLLAFCCGAIICTANFWFLARFAEANVRFSFSRGLAIKSFFGFTFRLVATALVLFALIIQFQVALLPLVAGLTSVIAGIFVWCIAKTLPPPAKEA
jgi:ATP synthase I chain.